MLGVEPELRRLTTIISETLGFRGRLCRVGEKVSGENEKVGSLVRESKLAGSEGRAFCFVKDRLSSYVSADTKLVNASSSCLWFRSFFGTAGKGEGVSSLGGSHAMSLRSGERSGEYDFCLLRQEWESAAIKSFLSFSILKIGILACIGLVLMRIIF